MGSLKECINANGEFCAGTHSVEGEKKSAKLNGSNIRTPEESMVERAKQSQRDL